MVESRKVQTVQEALDGLSGTQNLLIHTCRGAGKSTAIAKTTQRADLGTVGVFAPNRFMAEELQRKAGPKSEATFLAADHKEACVGWSFDTVLVDEPGLIPEKDMQNIIGAICYAKRVALVGSPNPAPKPGKEPEWFQRAYESGVWDNIHVPSAP